jgi:hypothetical protein
MTNIVNVYFVFDEEIFIMNTHHVGDLVEKRIRALNGEAR